MHQLALPLVQETGGRAIPAADLHMTLCFLGEVPAEQIAAMIDAAALIEPARIQLTLDRIDWWRRPRVLCLLPGVEPPRLQRLAEELRMACRSIGLEPDPKPFRAHLTVARKAGPANAARSWPQTLPQALPFTAEGFVLMQSTGAGDGPRYAVLQAWPPAPVRA